MSQVHKAVLYLALGFLGLSLAIPGLMDMFRVGTGTSWIIAETLDAVSHLRAVNGMIAALGFISLWACWNLARSRLLVIALGVVMLFLVIARLYSILVDGPPGMTSILYLTIEAAFAGIFLLWPPDQEM